MTMKITVFWHVRDHSSHAYKNPGTITLQTHVRTYVIKQHHNAVNQNKHLLSNSYNITLSVSDCMSILA
jgi:hypothetical protein